MTPEAVPRVPDRRREDPLLRQMLELLEATRATVASMSGRMALLERQIGEYRQLREALRFDDMSLDQKRAFLDLADWWLDSNINPKVRGEHVEHLVRISTILQAITAAVVAALTVWTVVHH
jgi:hypothetical protein